MADITRDSFHLVITIFGCVGFYYTRKQSQVMKIWKMFLYLSCVLITVLTFVSIVAEENIDMMQLNQSVIFFVEALAASLKFFLLMKNASKIRTCIHRFGAERFAPKNNEERKIIDHCVHLCQRNVKIFICVVTSAELYWNILPFFKRELSLPVKIWLPYQVTSDSTALYYLTYLYIAAVMAYFALVTATLDPLIGGLAFHAVSQLKILKYNLTYPTGTKKTDLKEYDDTFLLMKVVLIFGLSGACRRAELCALKTEDIEDVGSVLIVTLHDTKTKKKRVFTVT